LPMVLDTRERAATQEGWAMIGPPRYPCGDHLHGDAVSVACSLHVQLPVTAVSAIHVSWATRVGARANLFDYLEIFYNAQRRHSSLSAT
jgi:hypothetical protein